MTLQLRLLTPALLLALACTPKDDGSDDGDVTGAEETGGGSTSGDGLTSTDSDPTSPTSATNASSVSSGGSDSTTTSPGTTSPGTTDTEGSDEATSNGTVPGTSIGTTDDPSDTATDTSDPPPPPVPCDGDPQPIVAETIVAYTQAQIPPEPDPTSQSGTTIGTDTDPTPPDTLHIKFSDQQFSCADPNAILECGPHWEFTIIVPPDFQFPGTYNLAGDGPFAIVSETGKPEGMGNDCAAGGGGGFAGTFELINITPQTVEGRLCGIDALFSFADPNLNGSFVAERCQ